MSTPTDGESTPLLESPAEGIPDVLDTPEQIADLAEKLSQGTGPVAWDAERASGYRYSQRAYLVQGRREGVGSFLIDPIACPDLSSLTEACGDAEWVLHAANQDLNCLREVGLVPGGELFDTELGGRIAGFERVSLGVMVESLLGVRLAKEHSAVDWSTRPLPEPWLNYAALDVEVLIELRDAVEKALAEQDKLEWAHQEFAAVRDTPPPTPKKDPWRRTSTGHLLRHPRQQAMLRELWEAREEFAKETDVCSRRTLPDRAMVAAVKADPESVDDLMAIHPFSKPAHRKNAQRWFDALEDARDLDPEEWPKRAKSEAAYPHPKSWADRSPDASERLLLAKIVMSELSEELNIPAENILQPDLMRRVCWEPGDVTSETELAEALTGLGARPWQVSTVVSRFVAAWQDA